MSGLSAYKRVDNYGIYLEHFYVDEVDYMSTSCLGLCQEDPECFAWDEKVDGEYVSTASCRVELAWVDSCCFPVVKVTG